MTTLGNLIQKLQKCVKESQFSSAIICVVYLFVLSACPKKDPEPQVQVPTISDFTPKSGSTGTIVTITGTNFSATASENIVRFKNIQATVSAATTTGLTVSVPNGASTGKISVQVSNQTATSTANFMIPPWTQKADFGGTARYSAVGFAIGNKGYIGGGRDSNRKRDFWEYNPENNTWTQKADFGGTARSSAVGFAIGNKGYIGTGLESSTSTSNSVKIKKDFWAYNPENNTWNQKTDFGGTTRFSAVAFAIGNKGYIGIGTDFTFKKDFWEYTPED